jgi:flagella basal body P-ring formation protein FlgA
MMSARFRVIVVVIAVAAIAFGVYRNQQHRGRNAIGGPITVLVAKTLIQKGTTGDAVGADAGLYRLAGFSSSQIETGAIVDPSELVGKVVVKDIPAGQQLTAGDFDPLGKRRVLFPKNGLDHPQG